MDYRRRFKQFQTGVTEIGMSGGADWKRQEVGTKRVDRLLTEDARLSGKIQFVFAYRTASIEASCFKKYFFNF